MQSTDTREQAQPIPSFVVSHEAWYWQACKIDRTADIVIGLYFEGGGCKYEFGVSWGPCTHGTLRIHDDAFEAMTSPEFAGFFASLAAWGRDHRSFVHGRDLAPADVVGMLTAQGFKDATERSGPKS